MEYVYYCDECLKKYNELTNAKFLPYYKMHSELYQITSFELTIVYGKTNVNHCFFTMKHVANLFRKPTGENEFLLHHHDKEFYVNIVEDGYTGKFMLEALNGYFQYHDENLHNFIQNNFLPRVKEPDT